MTDFQDVENFLKNGGQRGPQRRILREGTYAFNLVQFVVITEERIYTLPLSKEEGETIKNMAQVIAERGGFRPVVIKDTDDTIGIVTVHDGPSLAQVTLLPLWWVMIPSSLRPTITNFRMPIISCAPAVSADGSCRCSLRVPIMSTVSSPQWRWIPKTIIEVGNVGVVVSYTGETGAILSGKEYRHGELVSRGQLGCVERTAPAGQVLVSCLRR